MVRASLVKRIAILTGNHICHNPRVAKEALTLAAAGYYVKVLGAWFDAELKRKDEQPSKDACVSFRPVVDLTEHRFTAWQARAKSKLGRAAYRFSGIENTWQLGSIVAPLKRAANQNNADLFLAHSETAMVVAADYAWNPRLDPISSLPYDPMQVLKRMYSAVWRSDCASTGLRR